MVPSSTASKEPNHLVRDLAGDTPISWSTVGAPTSKALVSLKSADSFKLVYLPGHKRYIRDLQSDIHPLLFGRSDHVVPFHFSKSQLELGRETTYRKYESKCPATYVVAGGKQP